MKRRDRMFLILAAFFFGFIFVNRILRNVGFSDFNVLIVGIMLVIIGLLIKISK